eukprot:2747699-Ditylum_brightwellii.AAC.1
MELSRPNSPHCSLECAVAHNNIWPVMLEGLIGDDLDVPGDGGFLVKDRSHWYTLPPLHMHFNAPFFKQVPMGVAHNIIVVLGALCSC